MKQKLTMFRTWGLLLLGFVLFFTIRDSRIETASCDKKFFREEGLLQAIFEPSIYVDNVHFIEVAPPAADGETTVPMYGVSQSVVSDDEMRSILREIFEDELVQPFPVASLVYKVGLVGLDEVVEERLAVFDAGTCGIDVAVNMVLYLNRYGERITHEEVLQLYRDYLAMTNGYWDWHERYFTGGEAWGQIGEFIKKKTNYDASKCIIPLKQIFDKPEQMYRQIENMLSKNIPVVMGYYDSQNNNALPFYKYNSLSNNFTVAKDDVYQHYFVITGIVNTSDGGVFLKVASWGEIYYVSWDEFVSLCGDGRFKDDVGTGIIVVD